MFPEHPKISSCVGSDTAYLHLTTLYRAGKDIINRLLEKSETRRLGSQSGASQVKQHKWFAKTNWGLFRNSTPPVRVPTVRHYATDLAQIIPATWTPDAPNSRHLHDSQSLQLEGIALPGVPGGAPGTEPADLFKGFSSVTLHYDGD